MDWEKPGRSVQPVAVKCAQVRRAKTGNTPGSDPGKIAMGRFQLCAVLSRVRTSGSSQQLSVATATTLQPHGHWTIPGQPEYGCDEAGQSRDKASNSQMHGKPGVMTRTTVQRVKAPDASLRRENSAQPVAVSSSTGERAVVMAVQVGCSSHPPQQPIKKPLL